MLAASDVLTDATAVLGAEAVLKIVFLKFMQVMIMYIRNNLFLFFPRLCLMFM